MAQEAEAGEARMLVGRRAEELAQPGRRGVLERRRYRARIVGPGRVARPVRTWASQVRTVRGSSRPASARDSTEPAELPVRCVSARIRRQSATRQGVPRRMALSNPPRPAGKRGNGNPVKCQLEPHRRRRRRSREGRLTGASVGAAAPAFRGISDGATTSHR